MSADMVNALVETTEGITSSSNHLLEVENVSVSFGLISALSGASLSVDERQIVGLIGPNGAGKTTLFNVISGFARPTSGQLRLEGRPITKWSAARRARAGLSRTFQNVGLDKLATVEENLRVAQEATTLKKELVECVLPRRRVNEHRRQCERDEVLEMLELGDVRKTLAKNLPMGLAKQVELACALLRRPRLLLLDEPSSGLSSAETAKLGKVLADLHANRHLSVLLIEHDMSLAMTLCQYLYVLNFGHLLAEGSPQTIRANPLVIEAYLGREAVS